MSLTHDDLLLKLRAELLETKQLITQGAPMLGARKREADSGLNDSISLLEATRHLLEDVAHSSGEPMRTLHHFASTGGTLFAKVIASLPNTFVLSEVHPRSPYIDPKNKFAPSDLALLSAAASIPDIDSLTDELFLIQVQTINEWVMERGGHLILRDHAHSDFCVANASMRSTVYELLSGAGREVWPICTVRHPADSFISAREAGFLRKGSEHTELEPVFEEYCKNYLNFLDATPFIKVIRYEDFVDAPGDVLREIASLWKLDYSDLATDIFALYGFSGDSGRSSDVISRRTTKPEAEHVRTFSGPNYKALIAKVGY